MEVNRRKQESEQNLMKSDRRNFGKAVLAGVLGGPAVLSSISQKAQGINSPAVSGKKSQAKKLALMLDVRDKERCILARQIGVNHAIVSLNRVLSRANPEQYFDKLAKLKRRRPKGDNEGDNWQAWKWGVWRS